MEVKEFTHVDVQSVREDFCVYEVENGQILKVKNTVGDIKNEKTKDGQSFGNIGFKDMSLVITPKPIDTNEYEYMPREKVKEEHQTKELKFKPIREIINIYETIDSIILVSTKVEKIFLTNKKDETGAPILRYKTASGINVIQKAQLTEKQDKENSQKS